VLFWETFFIRRFRRQAQICFGALCGGVILPEVLARSTCWGILDDLDGCGPTESALLNRCVDGGLEGRHCRSVVGFVELIGDQLRKEGWMKSAAWLIILRSGA